MQLRRRSGRYDAGLMRACSPGSLREPPTHSQQPGWPGLPQHHRTRVTFLMLFRAAIQDRILHGMGTLRFLRKALTDGAIC